MKSEYIFFIVCYRVHSELNKTSLYLYSQRDGKRSLITDAGRGALSAVGAEESKALTKNNYQMVNTQINSLAGVIDGTSALDQQHIVIFTAAAPVPYIVSPVANLS